jgi:hypothetical protein
MKTNPSNEPEKRAIAIQLIMNQFEERHRYPTGSLDLNAILPVLKEPWDGAVLKRKSQRGYFDRLLGCKWSAAMSGDMREQKMGHGLQGPNGLNAMVLDPVVKGLRGSGSHFSDQIGRGACRRSIRELTPSSNV